MLCIEGGRNASFIFSVFEVDDIMRFYFLLIFILFISTMLYKFPITLILIFVDN